MTKIETCCQSNNGSCQALPQNAGWTPGFGTRTLDFGRLAATARKHVVSPKTSCDDTNVALIFTSAVCAHQTLQPIQIDSYISPKY